MLRTLIWFIYFWLYQILALTLSWQLNILEKKDPQKAAVFLQKIAQDWAQAMVRATGSIVQIEGENNLLQNKAMLLVSNHQANFDIPLLLGYVNTPKGFIAKIELQKLPLVNKWMKKIHCVFLDRKNIRQSVKALDEAAHFLQNGHSMVIFPEGTRSKSAQLGEFKKGSLKIALKAEVPIIPIAINGSYNIMGAQGLIIKPAHVKISIGEPIFLEKLTIEEKNNLANLIREKIAAQL